MNHQVSHTGVMAQSLKIIPDFPVYPWSNHCMIRPEAMWTILLVYKMLLFCKAWKHDFSMWRELTSIIRLNGSVRLCEVLWGAVRCREVPWGAVRCCKVHWGNVIWCELVWGDVRWCEVMWGDVRWCEVMWGDVRWCVVILGYYC